MNKCINKQTSRKAHASSPHVWALPDLMVPAEGLGHSSEDSGYKIRPLNADHSQAENVYFIISWCCSSQEENKRDHFTSHTDLFSETLCKSSIFLKGGWVFHFPMCSIRVFHYSTELESATHILWISNSNGRKEVKAPAPTDEPARRI